MTTRYARTCLAVFALVLLATPSAAQDWLIIGGYSIRASGPGMGESTGRAPEDVGGAGVMLAGGGRYAARANEVYDRLTGQFYRTPDGVVVGVDPVRPRVFVRHACQPSTDECSLSRWDFLTGALTRLSSVWLGAGTDVTRYAVDADVLFVDQAQIRAAPLSPRPATRQIVAMGATSGTQIGVPIVDAACCSPWHVAPDGTRVFLHAPIDRVLAVNPLSGDVVGELPHAGISLAWNSPLDALLTSDGWTITAYSRSFQPIGTAPAGPINQCLPQVEVSPHTGRIFILSGGHYSFIDYPHELRMFDPAAGRWQSVDLTRRVGLPAADCHAMLLKTAPGPPRNLLATVSGHDVSLAWENVGAASGFVLDVGFAPGRTDLQVYLGPDSHTAFANVPSGTYYLRLRGGNEFGGGQPSGEIEVRVP